MQIDMFLLKDKKTTKARALSSATRIFNGRLTSPLSPTALESMKINRLGVSLSKNSNMKIEANMDNNQMALDILATIGCSQVTDPKVNVANYSLLSQQTDTEIIDNPNKIDNKNFKNIGKGKVSFKNILRDEESNFYRLDQQIPDNYIKEQEELKQDNPYEFNIIVSNLYDINFLNPSVTTLRSLKRSK